MLMFKGSMLLLQKRIERLFGIDLNGHVVVESRSPMGWPMDIASVG